MPARDESLKDASPGLAKITAQAKRGQSQWTSQFLVAAELARRGYTVSFMMGNHTPDADLMVDTPKGEMFWVDVKGQSSRSSWLVKPKKPKEQLFYVLVSIAPEVTAGQPREKDQFFVLTQAEASHLTKDYLKRHPNDQNKNPGFGFQDPSPHEDAWHKFPSA